MDKVKYASTKAHQRYRTADGEVVPGVTTVLGVIEKPALMKWAWECGMAGEDYRKSRDKAASIGTLAHWLVECHLRGLEPDTSEFAAADIGKAENAVLKFMGWWEGAGYRLLASELQLVHEVEKYGGTLDILAVRRDGGVVLVDIKTSKAIYPEYFRQVAAYGELYEFSRPFDERLTLDGKSPPPLSEYAIVRIGKEADDGDFEVQSRTDLTAHLATFRAALTLYRAIKEEPR
jgi:hypothetical protein